MCSKSATTVVAAMIAIADEFDWAWDRGDEKTQTHILHRRLKREQCGHVAITDRQTRDNALAKHVKARHVRECEMGAKSRNLAPRQSLWAWRKRKKATSN